MSPKLELSSTQITDLATLRDLGSPALERIVAQLDQLDGNILRPAQLSKAIAETISNEQGITDTLVRVVLSLRTLSGQTGLPTDEVLRAVRSSIERSSNWSDDQMSAWLACEPVLAKLIASSAVRRVATAIDLAYEYAFLLRKVRILTDIRPIFDDQANRIEGAVVSHTLRLFYWGTDGDHQLSIAMDLNDIHQLAEQCQRAITKAECARASMGSLGVPAIIAGTEAEE